jgi:glycosyltransferase involved in cell wall biosynthesis
LRNNENVILVELDDLSKLAKQLIDILENEPQRQAIGQRASQAIRNHFSWDSVCRQTLQVYQAAIQKRAG